jgi:hypothetical protein
VSCVEQANVGRRSTLADRLALARDPAAQLLSDLVQLKPQLAHWKGVCKCRRGKAGARASTAGG